MAVNIPLGLAAAPAAPVAPGLNIPLGFAAGPQAAPVASGLNIPLGLGQTAALVGDASQREVQVVRAVAAAAALAAPGKALQIAKAAKDDPAAFAEPAAIAENLLSPILAAVDRAMADRQVDPPPTARQIAAARAVGADPVLVAAAQAALQAGPRDAAETAMIWVAAINPQRLEAAAGAGARRRQLELVPQPSQQRRLDQIEARLKALEDRATTPPARGGSRQTDQTQQT
jgi:hypothetical protein